jgi:hypothetical protein
MRYQSTFSKLTRDGEDSWRCGANGFQVPIACRIDIDAGSVSDDLIFFRFLYCLIISRPPLPVGPHIGVNGSFVLTFSSCTFRDLGLNSDLDNPETRRTGGATS